MKKLLLFCLLLFISAESIQTAAQESKETKKEQGIFNSVAVGLGVGTTGINIDVASPIGNHFALRGEVNIMPGFSYSDEVDASVLNSATEQVYAPINVEGSLARTTGALLLNVYPFKSSSFFVCGGAYFGGAKFIKIEGHSDELQQLVTEGKEAGIEIGDYFIPVDKNGNVNGGLKVNSFRPYLGLGFGRAVPKKRIGFMFELGVQFHGTPEVYADNAELTAINTVADNEFSDIIDKLTVYPVLKFRLCGRIF